MGTVLKNIFVQRRETNLMRKQNREESLQAVMGARKEA
jgi:hypothetical protein